MKALRHAGIVVSDMQRSLKFYRDKLGLKTVADFEDQGDYIDTLISAKGIHLRMVKLVADDGGMIELLQYISHPMSRNNDNQLYEIGPTHVAFTVENVDKLYAELKVEGIRFTAPPIESPDKKVKLAFCQDPDGTFLELVEVYG